MNAPAYSGQVFTVARSEVPHKKDDVVCGVCILPAML